MDWILASEILSAFLGPASIVSGIIVVIALFNKCPDDKEAWIKLRGQCKRATLVIFLISFIITFCTIPAHIKNANKTKVEILKSENKLIDAGIKKVEE